MNSGLHINKQTVYTDTKNRFKQNTFGGITTGCLIGERTTVMFVRS